MEYIYLEGGGGSYGKYIGDILENVGGGWMGNIGKYLDNLETILGINLGNILEGGYMENIWGYFGKCMGGGLENIGKIRG